MDIRITPRGNKVIRENQLGDVADSAPGGTGSSPELSNVGEGGPPTRQNRSTRCALRSLRRGMPRSTLVPLQNSREETNGLDNPDPR